MLALKKYLMQNYWSQITRIAECPNSSLLIEEKQAFTGRNWRVSINLTAINIIYSDYESRLRVFIDEMNHSFHSIFMLSISASLSKIRAIIEFPKNNLVKNY